MGEDCYPECGTPNVIAIELMKEFRSMGGNLILWTCRYDEALEKAVAMCRTFGLEFDAINDNLPAQSALWRQTHPGCVMSRKIYADLYIDDKDPRAVLTGGIDWDSVSRLLFGISLEEFCEQKQLEAVG
jgi:hypothetical protein